MKIVNVSIVNEIAKVESVNNLDVKDCKKPIDWSVDNVLKKCVKKKKGGCQFYNGKAFKHSG